MEKEKKLRNLNIVFFESRHSKTLGDLIALQGGRPHAAPAMKEVPLENNADAFVFAEKLFQGGIDHLILLTGVGTKALVNVLETRYPREEVLEKLKKITLIPRGPKPIRVLKEWGVPFALTVPEPNTWRELLETLDANKKEFPISGKTVAVQEYGVTNPELLQGLEQRGARVLRVPVYRWALPDDLKPLTEAIVKIISGQMDVALFTTAVQCEHLFEVARKMKLENELMNAFQNIVVASVGPDCSEALRNRGLRVDIEPESPKMGPLVLVTAEKAVGALKTKRGGADCAVEVRSAVLQMTREKSPSQSVFLKACRRETTPYTPVWLMRQAGRYMKDYRDVREKYSFLDLCKNPELAAEVTVTAQEKLGTDAAIIFSDILLILEPMGMAVNYLKGGGPSIVPTLTHAGSVDRLRDVEPAESLSFVYEAIRETRIKLKKEIPIIGFAGGPFTLASYMVEGGSSKNFASTRKFMHGDLSRWDALMKKIVKPTIAYLNGQIAAGAEAVQIFDSWAGTLNAEEYEKFALPYTSELIQGITPGTPVIHFSTRTGAFLEKLSEAGGDVIGVDHRITLDEAWKKIGFGKAIQGNMDPLVLCADLEEIKCHAKRILKEAEGRPGHIFNLGHGVLPETPVENAVALVYMVHEMSQK